MDTRSSIDFRATLLRDLPELTRYVTLRLNPAVPER